MNYKLRARTKKTYFPRFRINAHRQPVVKSLDYDARYENWWGIQYNSGKEFQFQGPKHCHLLDLDKLVKVDDEPQIWGKTITNGDIETDDRCLKSEIPPCYYLDAMENDLDFLLEMGWTNPTEINVRLIPREQRKKLLKFKIGEECWLQPLDTLYCDHNNCRCPSRPVKVIITDRDPHIFIDQMRPEYQYKVKYPSRRRINDGWIHEEGLKPCDGTQINCWFYDEDDIHLNNLRRSIQCGLFKKFSAHSRISVECRTLDLRIDSALFGKHELYLQNKDIAHQLAAENAELTDLKILTIKASFSELITKNMKIKQIIKMKLKDAESKTLYNRGMPNVLSAKGLYIYPLEFDFETKTFLQLNRIIPSYDMKIIEFFFPIDFVTTNIGINPIVHTTRYKSEIRLVSGIKFKYYREKCIVIPTELKYIKLSRHQVQQLNNDNIQ
eukprot:45924_1